MGEPGEVATIGVVGEVSDPTRKTLQAAPLDRVVIGGPLDALRELSPDAILCFGTAAYVDVACADLSVPIVPVDGPWGTQSVAADRLETAVDDLVAGRWKHIDRPRFSVSGTGTDRTAVLSITCMADAGGITEFGLETRGDGDARTPVDRVRADGVTLSTPLGSQGYAHAAGGPIMGPETAAASVVPIGPFSIDTDHWVLVPPVWVTVKRDESDVTLDVDGETVGPVPAGDAVVVRTGKTVGTIVPESAGPYFRRADRLEKT